MGADVLDAEIAQHADGFQRSLTGVLRGNTRFALAPAGDAFKQGAAAVPLRLARGEGGVKMDMRLDEGRIASRPRRRYPLRQQSASRPAVMR